MSQERTGLTFQRFIVHPGIIDDFEEEIKIMAYIKNEMHFNASDRIVQLYCFPISKPKLHQQKEQKGLEVLENVFWRTVVYDERSELKQQVNGIEIEGLVGTGADVTIISERSWNSE